MSAKKLSRFKPIKTITFPDPEDGLEQEFQIVWDSKVGAPIGLDSSHIEQVDEFYHPYTGEVLFYDDYDLWAE